MSDRYLTRDCPLISYSNKSPAFIILRSMYHYIKIGKFTFTGNHLTGFYVPGTLAVYSLRQKIK